MSFITRFAPSPTGPLHLGHAYSALVAQQLAQDAKGQFLLRIEDIDQSRARLAWEERIYDDLNWLGLRWSTPVLRQSTRQPIYDAALDKLWARGLLYPCQCNRRDIQAAVSAPQEGAPLLGPDGLVYPGTCRPAPVSTPDPKTPRPRDVTLRLNMKAALATGIPAEYSTFTETGAGPRGEYGSMVLTPDALITSVGDVVVARKDMGTSYHLSVVLDDAAQNVTDVVRGQDLFDATPIHVVLQSLLGLPKPRYHHHQLIRDDTGKRLAKRDDARAIATYRDGGITPEDIKKMIGLL